MDITDHTLPLQQGEPSHFSAAYIERATDRDLLHALLGGEFVHLLGPPGSGKSSLRRRAAADLSARGIRCVSVDLSRMGAEVPSEGFYYAMLGQIAEQLGLPDPTHMWTQREALSPARRFSDCLREALLPAVAEPLVIFIDEIDAVRAIGAEADGLFMALHGLLTGRSTDRSLRRLCFCLIGATAPEDLFRPLKLDPAQLARPMELHDFTPGEAAGFLPILPGAGDAPDRLLAEVLRFTDGHPAMTSALCQALARQGEAPAPTGESLGPDAAALVGEAVAELYLSPQAPDPILSAARQTLEAGHAGLSASRRARALSLYRRLLFHERVPAEPGEPVQRSLWLRGLIKEVADPAGLRWLRVRNRIVESALGPDWIEGQDQRPPAQALLRWLRAGKDPAYLLRGEDLDAALAAEGTDDGSGQPPPGVALGEPSPRRFSLRDLSPSSEEQEFLRAALAVRQEDELRRTREELAQLHQDLRVQRERQQHKRRLVLSAMGAIVVGCSLGLAALWQRADRAAGEARGLQAQVQEANRRVAEARGNEERTRQIAEHAVARLVVAARGGTGHRADSAGQGAPDDGLPDAATWQAGIVGGPVPMGGPVPIVGGPARPEELIDSLTAMALARQAEGDGRAAALVTGIRLVGQRLKEGGALPAEAVAGLGAATSATLAEREGRGEGILPTLRGHSGVVRHAAFSPDGSLIATASDDESARLWDGRSGKLLAVLKGHQGLVRRVAFAPDGHRLVTASNDNTARIFTAPEGELLAVLGGHRAEVRSAVFSADGRRVVTASGDGTARIWEAATGKLLSVLRGHSRDVVSAQFSADGARVLTASLDGNAALWQADTGKQIVLLHGHAGPLSMAAFAPGDKLIVSAGADGTARLWDGAGQARQVLRGHQQAVLVAAFSADGKRVLTAGQDGTARVWDATTGAALATLRGHRGAVLDATFSADGERLVTGGADHTTRLWQGDGRPLLTWSGQRQSIYAVAFSPDGKRVVAASGDRSARLYPGDARGLLDLGCKLLAGRPELKELGDFCRPSS